WFTWASSAPRPFSVSTGGLSCSDLDGIPYGGSTGSSASPSAPFVGPREAATVAGAGPGGVLRGGGARVFLDAVAVAAERSGPRDVGSGGERYVHVARSRRGSAAHEEDAGLDALQRP